MDEIERGSEGRQNHNSVNEDPDGIVDYHSLTIRSALSTSSTGEEDFENSGVFSQYRRQTRLQHNKCVVPSERKKAVSGRPCLRMPG